MKPSNARSYHSSFLLLTMASTYYSFLPRCSFFPYLSQVALTTPPTELEKSRALPMTGVTHTASAASASGAPGSRETELFLLEAHRTWPTGVPAPCPTIRDPGLVGLSKSQVGHSCGCKFRTKTLGEADLLVRQL